VRQHAYSNVIAVDGGFRPPTTRDEGDPRIRPHSYAMPTAKLRSGAAGCATRL
jgi:hypothetical protein